MARDLPTPTGEALLQAYIGMKRRGTLLIWAAMLGFIGVMILSALIDPPVPQNTHKLGVHLLLDDGRSQWDTSLWPDHIAYAGRMAGEGAFAVQLIREDDLNPTRWQQFIDLCAAESLTPMVRLATTFDRGMGYWRAPDVDTAGSYAPLAQKYADFLGQLDWHGLTPHVILLNEVNNGDEWGGKPDAAAYARYVAEVVPVLRAAVPAIRILNAALDVYAPNTGSQPFPDGFYSVDADTFMTQLYTADPEFFAAFDLWNSHSYPPGFAEPPANRDYHFDVMHDATPDFLTAPAYLKNRGINGYEWELWRLAKYDVTHLRVVITETGYRYGGTYPDEATAAKYLEWALRGDGMGSAGWQPLLTDARVAGVVIFALDGNPSEWAHTNLLKITDDGHITGTTLMYDTLVETDSEP